MTKPISAIILAAGLSRRMGTPKMLLPWGRTSVLGQVITTFAEAGVAELVVVTGGFREQIEAEIQRQAQSITVCSVYNPDFELGEMLSSIQHGLSVLNSDSSAALIGLGDQPQISFAAVSAVMNACEAGSDALIVPSFNMRRGHPWLIGTGYWPELMGLQPPLTTRDFLNAHSSAITYVQADITILKDLDTPQDYQREKP